MAKKKKDFGNNYFPSGWGPKYDFDEQAGVGEITHVGTDPNYKSKFDKILLEWGFDPEYYEICLLYTSDAADVYSV